MLNVYPAFVEQVAFGSVTASFADVGTLPRPYRKINVFNTTDADIGVAIGSGSTDTIFVVPPRSTINREIYIFDAVRIKYVGSAPTFGKVYVDCTA